MARTHRDLRAVARWKWWNKWYPSGYYENSAHVTRDCKREEDHAHGVRNCGMYAGMGVYKQLERRRQRYAERTHIEQSFAAEADRYIENY